MITVGSLFDGIGGTPDDDLAFFGPPPMLVLPEIDEIHVSVAFNYDMDKAEWLANQWSVVGVPVKMGGPAFNQPGGEFTPGMYLKTGYVLTSRGCPNRCWFCSVPKREGETGAFRWTDEDVVEALEDKGATQDRLIESLKARIEKVKEESK